MDGSKSWTIPEGFIEKNSGDTVIVEKNSSSSNSNSRKRPLEESVKEEIAVKRHESGPKAAPSMPTPVVGIIVPFRDLHKEQKRSQHLNQFIPEMSRFLQGSNKAFRIYIIEQSDDGRKFNRGKLLNIGFDLAKKDGCKVFVFHDVDLIPSSPSLLPFYTNSPPTEGPVHIARVWDRYNR